MSQRAGPMLLSIGSDRRMKSTDEACLLGSVSGRPEVTLKRPVAA